MKDRAFFLRSLDTKYSAGGTKFSVKKNRENILQDVEHTFCSHGPEQAIERRKSWCRWTSRCHQMYQHILCPTAGEVPGYKKSMMIKGQEKKNLPKGW